jgi:hypothetical protein
LAVCAELLGSSDTRPEAAPFANELRLNCGLSTIVDLIEFANREYPYDTFTW